MKKMKKRLQIAKKANLVDEAFLILYQWANKDCLDQAKEIYRKNYLDDPDRYNQIWDTVLSIYDAVKEKLKSKKEQIDYYFKSPNLNLFSNASFAFLWEFQNGDNQLMTYEDRIRDMSEEDRVKYYAQIVNIDENDDSALEGIATYDDFLRLLDASAYDKDVKWDVLTIFHNQKENYNEVASILKEVIAVLENKFSKQMAQLEEQFYDYWTNIHETRDVIDLVRENMKLSWKENDMGTILLPMIFNPISVTLSTIQDSNTIDVLRFGILIDQRFNMSRKKVDSEDIVNFSKLLSDKSKVEILQLAARKPCYGKEIATELNLSTATISYHVNALMRFGLLKTELSANRVYYCTNVEKLLEYLEEIKDYYSKG